MEVGDQLRCSCTTQAGDGDDSDQVTEREVLGFWIILKIKLTRYTERFDVEYDSAFYLVT